jgi:uncharacterized membrane protein
MGTTRVTDRRARILRALVILDGTLFLAAALLNMGVQLPLGLITLRFADPVWQAGTGEAVIGVALLVAGWRRARRLSWVAWWMSVLGIAIGLTSHRVQGAARELHVVLIPLAALILALLLRGGRRGRTRPRQTAPRLGEETK